MPAQINQAFYARNPAPSQAWASRGACARHPDPDLWFAPGDEARQEQAIAICDTCPVKASCLDYALSIPRLPGIWGGTTQTARTRLQKARRQRQAA